MTQCVLPRIREWEGVEAIGDDKGSMAWTLPASAVGCFPDIEPHFDSFPRLFDVDLMVQTTGKSDWETALCLSGFQIPFKPKRIVKVAKVEESNDPWAKFKKPKTKEERKAAALKRAAEAGNAAA